MNEQTEVFIEFPRWQTLVGHEYCSVVFVI